MKKIKKIKKIVFKIKIFLSHWTNKDKLIIIRNNNIKKLFKKIFKDKYKNKEN